MVVRSDGPRDGRTPEPGRRGDPSPSHPQSATRNGGRHETTTPGTVGSECWRSRGALIQAYGGCRTEVKHKSVKFRNEGGIFPEMGISEGDSRWGLGVAPRHRWKRRTLVRRHG